MQWCGGLSPTPCSGPGERSQGKTFFLFCCFTPSLLFSLFLTLWNLDQFCIRLERGGLLGLVVGGHSGFLSLNTFITESLEGVEGKKQQVHSWYLQWSAFLCHRICIVTNFFSCYNYYTQYAQSHVFFFGHRWFNFSFWLNPTFIFGQLHHLTSISNMK